MNINSIQWLYLVILSMVLTPCASAVSWSQILKQKDAWYRGQEAKDIADQVLLYQREIGGWEKNIDMAQPLTDAQKNELIRTKPIRSGVTIDNGATYTQLRFLAKVYTHTRVESYKESFLAGLDFLLAIQYENGGWPQFPYKNGYAKHITFNDNAMVSVVMLLKDIVDEQSDFRFLDKSYIEKASVSLQKGIDCILQCQIKVNGVLTAWCAQHDEYTLEPAPARSYEKISISGSESVGIVRFLMSFSNPTPPMRASIIHAVQWFREATLTGIRVERVDAPEKEKGYDVVVIADDQAKPLWARFYEIGTNTPIFCGRDGVIKETLAEIEHERRIGYSWYTDRPAELLEEDYPQWHNKIDSSIPMDSFYKN